MTQGGSAADDRDDSALSSPPAILGPQPEEVPPGEPMAVDGGVPISLVRHLKIDNMNLSGVFIDLKIEM